MNPLLGFNPDFSELIKGTSVDPHNFRKIKIHLIDGTAIEIEVFKYESDDSLELNIAGFDTDGTIVTAAGVEINS